MPTKILRSGTGSAQSSDAARRAGAAVSRGRDDCHFFDAASRSWVLRDGVLDLCGWPSAVRATNKGRCRDTSTARMETRGQYEAFRDALLQRSRPSSRISKRERHLFRRPACPIEELARRGERTPLRYGPLKHRSAALGSPAGVISSIREVRPDAGGPTPVVQLRQEDRDGPASGIWWASRRNFESGGAEAVFR